MARGADHSRGKGNMQNVLPQRKTRCHPQGSPISPAGKQQAEAAALHPTSRGAASTALDTLLSASVNQGLHQL